MFANHCCLLRCLCLCLIPLYLGTASVICVVLFRACVLANWRARTHSTLCVFHPNVNFAAFERWTHLRKTNLRASPAAAPSHAAGTVIAVAVLLHSGQTNCSFVVFFFTCLTRLRNREATGSQHLVSGLLTCLPVAGSSAVRLHFLAAYVACLETCNYVLCVCKTTRCQWCRCRCYCDS